MSSLTSEHIISFYQIVASASYTEKGPLSGILAIIRKSYHNYLLHCLKKSNLSNSSIEGIPRNLISQINLLKEKHFFQDKMDLKCVDLIIEDIAQKGSKLLELIPEAERDDFLNEIQNTHDNCQANISTPRNYPEVIRTGLSIQEINSLNYSHPYQVNSISRNHNSKGLEHYEKKEWREAIQCFENAIAAETNLTSELKIEKDEKAISVYQRNIAITYHELALHFQNERDFLKSIENYRNAINILQNIQFIFKTRNDEENLAYHFRDIAFSLNSLGTEKYNQSLFAEARHYYQDAIDTHCKIAGYSNDIDETNLIIYYRNLALTFTHLAIQTFNENQFDQAIEHYQSTLVQYEKIGNYKTEDDYNNLSDCLHHLAVLYNARGIDFHNQNNHKQALKNYANAITTFNKIPSRFLTEYDAESLEGYQRNLEYSSMVIAYEEMAALNQHGFLNKMNEKSQIVTPSVTIKASKN